MKIEVNGDNAHLSSNGCIPRSLLKDLESVTRPSSWIMLSCRNSEYASNPDIKWNFTKFLIDRKGHVAARFEPTVTPKEMETKIKELL